VRSSVKAKKSKSKGTAATSLIRILGPDKKFLEALAAKQCQSMPHLLNGILKRYRRQEFFEDLAAAYSELRSDPRKWSAEIDERRLYESTLLDGFQEI
jgi:hypothetical protein